MRDVVGTWRLVDGVATTDAGEPMAPPYGGEKAMGRVTLNADGRMVAVLCDGRVDIPEGETRDYTSYCGQYTFDGETLSTRVDACSDPARFGTDQVRQVSFDGDLMVLRPPPRVIDGVVQHRVLRWEKIADI
ncbi:MAG: lipocalin-like domain-containing protein [Alphaproteobacteria bacterium]|jgi:hypothetical protein|nr:lipocalin-like domain-containing protein [Alphaproteobacteria bacterium]